MLEWANSKASSACNNLLSCTALNVFCWQLSHRYQHCFPQDPNGGWCLSLLSIPIPLLLYPFTTLSLLPHLPSLTLFIFLPFPLFLFSLLMPFPILPLSSLLPIPFPPLLFSEWGWTRAAGLASAERCLGFLVWVLFSAVTLIIG